MIKWSARVERLAVGRNRDIFIHIGVSTENMVKDEGRFRIVKMM